MASVKENLIAAKALIDTPDKWAQREYGNGLDRMCAIGAIRFAAGRDYSEAEVFMDRFVYNETYGRHAVTEEFNDHPDTTHVGIMALFQRAIEASE